MRFGQFSDAVTRIYSIDPFLWNHSLSGFVLLQGDQEAPESVCKMLHLGHLRLQWTPPSDGSQQTTSQAKDATTIFPSGSFSQGSLWSMWSVISRPPPFTYHPTVWIVTIITLVFSSSFFQDTWNSIACPFKEGEVCRPTSKAFAVGESVCHIMCCFIATFSAARNIHFSFSMLQWNWTSSCLFENP